MRCDKTATVGDVLQAVEQKLGLEDALAETTKVLSPEAVKISGSFTLDEVRVKPFIKFEGEEFDNFAKMDFLTEGATAFLELKIVIVQIGAPEESACCVIT